MHVILYTNTYMHVFCSRAAVLQGFSFTLGNPLLILLHCAIPFHTTPPHNTTMPLPPLVIPCSHLQCMLLYKTLTSAGVDPDHPSYRAMERALATNARRSEGGVIRSRLVGDRVTHNQTPGAGVTGDTMW
jgi:hypothetical protein